MDGDFESKKYGYFVNSYFEVLDTEVTPAYASLDPDYIFIQDNAVIHTAHKVHTWFSDYRITRIIDWLPYFPDLNSIEYIWSKLKTRVFKMFPEIASNTSKSEEARAWLKSAVQAV